MSWSLQKKISISTSRKINPIFYLCATMSGNGGMAGGDGDLVLPFWGGTGGGGCIGVKSTRSDDSEKLAESNESWLSECKLSSGRTTTGVT
jgi:hypothetical protein